jgi:hypothetical protein
MKLTEKEKQFVAKMSPGKLKKFLAKIQTMERVAKVKSVKEAAVIMADGIKGKKQDQTILQRLTKPFRNKLVTK